MSEDVVIDAPARGTARAGGRDHRRGVLLSLLSMLAVLGPALMVGAIVLWALLRG